MELHLHTTLPGGACAAFGCFDGMHTGHTRMLRRLKDIAEARGCIPVLLTYPAEAPVLTTEPEKAEIARSLGIEYIASIPDCSADMLAGQLGAKYLLIEAGANADALAQAAKAAGIEVESADIDADVSRQLHRALDACDPEAYAEICGRPYVMTGTVVHGKGLGHTVGMPTANLSAPDGKHIPGEGVYAVIAHVGGEAFMGLTNVGRRPSVDREERFSIETNLFDFSRDIYGAPMTLEFRFFIRGVKKLHDLQAVREQVQRDIAQSIDRLSAVFGNASKKPPHLP